jgi:Na+/H+ antiporter NhaD/arsenite permease-like protein
VNTVGIAVFILTYVLISLRRLSWLGFDRPAGALLGAMLCVLFRVLTPAQAVNAVDGSTLLLLFGVMGMGAFLAVDGFFDHIEARCVATAKTRQRLLAFIVWGAGILSAFVTNDAVCVLGAPLVVRLVERQKLPAMPYLLALATAANTGSAATLVGNPQNMLCGLLGGLVYREHLLLVGPIALFGLCINHGVLVLMFRRDLRGDLELPKECPAWLTPRTRTSLIVIGLTAVAYTLGAHLAWAAAGGFVVMMLLHRRDTSQLWPHIDWSVLLFFSGLFVVVEGFLKSGAPAWLFARYPLSEGAHGFFDYVRLSGIFLVGSNIVSNVPFILVVRDQMTTLVDPKLGWELLAMASTFAGNLTLLGSVANIIVAENARPLGGIGFLAYLRVGFPIALLTTLFGTVYLVLILGH